MQDPVTTETKRELLDQFGKHMSIDTLLRVTEIGNCPEVVEWKIDKMTRMLAHLKARVDAGLPPGPTEE
eukprot:15223354-Heterocapsa_arctica.AAC.1